jgi:hypothetical protein
VSRRLSNLGPGDRVVFSSAIGVSPLLRMACQL